MLKKIFACLSLLTLPAGFAPAAENDLANFLPPQTKVVIGIRVRALAESPVVKSMLAQSTAVPAGAADWLKLTSAMGFDPLRDIDEVLIGSAADRQDAPALVVVRGRFNPERLAAGATRYRNVPMISGAKDPASVLALLDATHVLAGNAAEVRAAIDRGGQGALPAAFAARLEAARGQFDIWGVGDAPDRLVAPVPAGQGLESVDRFQFGIGLSHGLELGAEAHTRTPKDVEQLAATLALLQTMMKSRQGDASQFDVRVENGTLHLRLAVPEEDIRKAIEAQSARLRQAQAPKPEVQILPAPAPTDSPRVLNPGGGTGAIRLPGR